MLRRPVESTQYLSIRYSERLAEAKIDPSVGSRGDSYDNALAETINSMTDTLRTFADQVTSVAREVGIEGKLGGQAKVPGAAGTWKDLTDNVNQLAGNLTSQVSRLPSSVR